MFCIRYIPDQTSRLFVRSSIFICIYLCNQILCDPHLKHSHQRTQNTRHFLSLFYIFYLLIVYVARQNFVFCRANHTIKCNLYCVRQILRNNRLTTSTKRLRAVPVNAPTIFRRICCWLIQPSPITFIMYCVRTKPTRRHAFVNIVARKIHAIWHLLSACLIIIDAGAAPHDFHDVFPCRRPICYPNIW